LTNVTAIEIPELLAGTARFRPEVAAWTAELPDIVAAIGERWSLRVGTPFQPGGDCSWTAPAARLDSGSGENLVLKVGFPFGTGEHRDEAAALRIWDGDGAIRLHAALSTDTAHALLLERCLPGTRLRDALPEPEVDVVLAGMLRRLWARASAARASAARAPAARASAAGLPDEVWPFRPLTEMCDEWADEFTQQYAAAPPAERIDPGLVKDGIALFRELPRTATDSVLLCTDLHFGNILAARREPWLVIDPKPYVGDPAFDVLQHLINCHARLAADPLGLADRMAALTGLDASRVRLWLFARVVQESVGFAYRVPLMREVAARLAPP
jgi:streptomycin 6-kinase